jgi:hypothetical protein
MWLVQWHGEARIKQWWCDQVFAMVKEEQGQPYEAQGKGINRVLHFSDQDT